MSAAEEETGPLFNSYRWGHDAIDSVQIPGEVFRRFLAKTNHVGNGITAVLELIEMSQIEESQEPGRPIISANRAGNLMRLAIASAEYLAEDAEKLNDWAYEYHTPEGIKERRELSKY